MSSTQYLDDLLLDQRALVTREVMDSIKGYCGLFSFVHAICRDDLMSDDDKVSLIDNIIVSSLTILRKKYEANIELYKKQVSENPKAGKLFESLSVLPAKMTEDFELGLEDAYDFLYIEIRDMLKIINVDLDI